MILVTGANGQLGATLKEILTTKKTLFFSKNELNITNLREVENIVHENKCTSIINCAAYTAVDKAEIESDLAYKVNVLGAKNLARTGVPIIHISTDYVFDGKKRNPYLETDEPNPISVYGKTKLESEKVIFENAETAVIIRTSWLYSKKYGSNFLKTMLRLGAEKEYINVVSDQIGSPTNAQNLTALIVDLIPKISSGMKEIYHFSNEGSCSWYELAQEIMKNAGLRCRVVPIESKDYYCAARRPMYSVLDTSKITKDFKLRIPHWIDSLIGHG